MPTADADKAGDAKLDETIQTAAAAQKPAKTWRSRLKMLLYVFAGIIIALALLWLFGPREPVVTDIRFDPATMGDDIDAYLSRVESVHEDIVPGLEKEVVWAFPGSRAKTPVSLVYIHGFSATKGETRPLTDLAAKTLDANIFYTRLAGHGRSNEAMAEPDVQDWIDDLAEAVEIGNRTGARTVLVTASTGGTIAAIGALETELADSVDGIVFISPNFKLTAATAGILTMPFAETLVPLLAGQTRSFEPSNDLHASLWTHSYPSVSLLPMAAAVGYAEGLLYERTDIPALFVFSDADTVVDHTRTREVHARWGGPKQIITVDDSQDPHNHVIAGDALSPNTTERLASDLAQWVAETVKAGN